MRMYQGAGNSFSLSSFIGTSIFDSSGNGGPVSSALISRPNGLWTSTDGVMYVGDIDYNIIRRVDSASIINTFAGTGTAASLGDGGAATAATFNSLYSLWGSSVGVLYASEKLGFRIRSIQLSSGIVSTYAGTGTSGSSGNSGPATSAQIGFVSGLQGDTMVNLYLADSMNTVRRIVFTSGIISVVCGTGSGTFNGDGLAATSTNLLPSKVLISSQAMYIGESSGYRVRYMSTAGTVTTIAGTGISTVSGDGGPASSATINTPDGLAADTQGNIYVTATYSHYILQITPANIMYIVAGNGQGGISSGAATCCNLGYPKANWIDSVGIMYVPADSSVRKLVNTNPTVAPSIAPSRPPSMPPTMVPTSIVPSVAPSVAPTFLPTTTPSFAPNASPTSFWITAYAGTNSAAISGDGGAATSAQLSSVQGIWMNTAGVLYIADTVVRSISTAGIITKFAGGGSTTGDGGKATAATINTPQCVWGNTIGVVYICEYGSNKIRAVATSNIISTFAGTGTSDYTGIGGQATAAAISGLYGVGGDTSGTMYIIENAGATDVVRVISSSGIITLFAGVKGSNVYSGEYLRATSSCLHSPQGIFVDSSGINVYVAEAAYRVRLISAGLLSTYAGSGSVGFTGDAGKATAATIGSGWGIASDSTGVVYIVTNNDGRIRQVNAGLIYTVTGIGTSSTNSGDNGPAVNAALQSPSGVVVDANGIVYVAAAAMIRKLTNNSPTAQPTMPTCTPTRTPTTCPTVVPSTATPTVVPSTAFPTNVNPFSFSISANVGTGSSGASGDGGAATSAQVSGPPAIWMNTVGVLYIADSLMRSVNAAGIITKYAGGGSSTGDGGQVTASTIYTAQCVWGNTMGVVYICEHDGYKIRAVAASGIISTYAGTGSSSYSGNGGQATSATLSGVLGLWGDSIGSLYFSGDEIGTDIVRTISPTGIINLFAGIKSSGGYSGENLRATSSLLYGPYGIFADSVGNVFITENALYRVRQVSSGYMTSVVGTGIKGFSGDGSKSTSAMIDSPCGIASDSQGVMYFATYGDGRIRQVSSAVIYTVAGVGSSTVNSGDNGPAINAALYGPQGVAIDVSGSVYVSVTAMVRKLTNNSPTALPTMPTCVPTHSPSTYPTVVPTLIPTDVPSTIAPTSKAPTAAPSASPPTSFLITAYAGTGSSGTSGDGGQATSGTFSLPYCMWQDSQYALYFADYFEQRVRKIGANGIISTFSGTGTPASTGDGGMASAASLFYPTSLWGDTAGRLFIGESSGSRVRAITLSSTLITTYAGEGNAGSNGDGGAATAARLNAVYGVYGNSAGALYLADELNMKIRFVSASGIITTFCGTGSTSFNNDGQAATSTNLNDPWFVLLYGSQVFISEYTGNRVRSVSGAGIVSTFAGNGLATFNGDGGPASAASISTPYGIFMDSTGSMYAADSNSRIRQVSSVGIMYTVAGTGVSGITGNGGPAMNAKLGYPKGLWGDTIGSVYITETYSMRRLFNINPTTAPSKAPSCTPSNSPVSSPSTFYLSTAVGTGVDGSTGNGGQATTAQIYRPVAVWATTTGILFAADKDNNIVRRVDAAGFISTYVGTGNSISVGDGGPSSNACINNPRGLFGNSVGVLYVAEFAGNRIRSVTLSTNIISTYVGSDTVGSTGNGGKSTAATVAGVYGLFGDTVGSLFLSDYSSANIRKVDFSGIITLFAGTGTNSNNGDGLAATSTNIDSPSAGYYSLSGVYFTEYNSHRLRSVSNLGFVSTLAGTGFSGTTGAGGAATAALLNYPWGVASDAQGNLFVAEVFGHVIHQITPSSILYSVAGIGGAPGYSTGVATSAALAYPKGNWIDSMGVMFIACDGAVRKMTNISPTVSPSTAPSASPTVSQFPTLSPSAAPVTASISFLISTAVGSGVSGSSGDGGQATAARMGQSNAIWISTAGVMYFDVVNYHTVRRVDASSIINTFVGNGASTSAGDGGKATAASINNPTGVWGSSTGILYVSESAGFKIRAINLATNIITTEAGTGVSGSTGIGGQATSAQVSGPYGVFGDSVGQLYFIDSNVVRRIESTGILKLYCGSSGGSTYNGENLAATSADLYNPASLYVSGASLYISEYDGQRVRFVSSSSIVTTFAGSGTSGNSGYGGAATAALIYLPWGISSDSLGNVYFVSLGNFLVNMVTTTGTIYSVAGTGTAAFSGDNGAATSAQLASPMGIWVDTTSVVFVAGSSSVRKLTNNNPTLTPTRSPSQSPTIIPVAAPVSFLIYSVAGSGSYGSAGNGGPATSALISRPNAVWVSSTGVMYTDDVDNHVVRKVDVTGIISNFAGTGTAASLGDGGLASSASINYPGCVWGNSLGTVYVSEVNGLRVRSVSAANIISTYVGVGAVGWSGDGGQATAAKLSGGYGLSGDTSGTLYYGDYFTCYVRRIDANGIITSVAGTGSAVYNGDFMPATSTNLVNPISVSYYNQYIFVSEYSGHRVRLMSTAGIVMTFIGTGTAGVTVGGTAATSAAVNTPYGLGGDTAGHVYLAVMSNQNCLTIMSSVAYVVAGLGYGVAGFSTDGAPASSSALAFPKGISVDSLGSVYLSGDASIRKLVNNSPTVAPSFIPTIIPSKLPTITPSALPSAAPSTSFNPTANPSNSNPTAYYISRYAGNGASGRSGDGGQATAAQVIYPSGVWIDSIGVLYLTDTSVRSISTSGIISTFIGGDGTSSTGDGGMATAATVNNPQCVWGSSMGDVYICDYEAKKIRIISSLNIITTFAGSGVGGSNGNGFAATSAAISSMYSVGGNTNGAIYFAQASDGYIRFISTSGIMNIVVGTGTYAYSGEFTKATSTNINSPQGVMVDKSGFLCYSESGGHRVRKLSGTVYTVAGNGNAGFSGDGGVGSAAQLNLPRCISSDTLGSMFIISVGDCRVRMVSSNIIYTIAGQNCGVSSGNNGPALSAGFNGAYAVSSDSIGSIFVGSITEVRRLVNINPTTLPTMMPTVLPTTTPSFLPTVMPTVMPSLPPSLQPTVIPSQKPSIAPSSLPTVLPTLSPTLNPTVLPTAVPSFSVVPSLTPTVNPTILPTCVPSVVPSLGPSLPPSVAPSVVPTIQPTTKPPSSQPSNQPSQQPSEQPSSQPSNQPTGQPSCQPSLQPIVRPTSQPSSQPSGQPSTQPTSQPAVSPTLTPSGCPTEQPSSQPSFQPTYRPLAQPSVCPSSHPTDQPSTRPTCPSRKPTVQPSILPTQMPSIGVSLTPSLCPTLTPTRTPAADPSYQPSALPTILSTRSPTCIPSICPSVIPSLSPSGDPTILPSLSPTLFPSVLPTTQPSLVPISGPSPFPSTGPSQLPSMLPSVIVPTEMPTSQPIVPSPAPTMGPSHSPSVGPTLAPTLLPSGRPTPAPSTVPSEDPSYNPRCVPTAVPSICPSTIPSLDPSVLPSALPSMEPSCSPSVSPTEHPSDSPSIKPSVKPTRGPISPTIRPTNDPSLRPTVTPTVGPSLRPTQVPSVTPSIIPSVSPTLMPSVKPTVAPTIVPTVISNAPQFTLSPTAPTVLPSLEPTVIPCKAPSLAPSQKPTERPVIDPTHKPTRGPTLKPSVKPTRDPTLAPTRKPTNVPSIKPSAIPSVKPTIRPTLIPTTPTVAPSQPRPSISPSPTFDPTTSGKPTVCPSHGPSQIPSTLPSLIPSSAFPSMTPSETPTVVPTTSTPSMVPTTQVPSAVPSTLEFYTTHPKATLPSNQSISVVSLSALTSFKIVLPFLTMSSGNAGVAFSDVVVGSGTMGTAFVVNGGSLLLSSIDATAGGSYSNAISFDSAKRAVSLIQDFNGDGYSDLIIGDPFASRCYVLFGNQIGLTNMTKGFTIFGQDGDLTGWSVSGAGDFNNDTMQDILIGAPFARGVGAVYVIYGKHSVVDVYLSNLTASDGFAMFGSLKSDYLGISVSNAGDVNKDGCDDIVVGSVGTAAYFAGAAYIVYGGKSLQFVTSSAILAVSQGYKLSGVSYQYAGYSVSSVGDVNKDGYDDVLIGSCPQRTSIPLSAFLVFGAPTTLVNSNVQLASLSSPQGVRITGAGVVVSGAGDVNHDTFEDVLVITNVESNDLGGWIVYSNVKVLRALTVVPTFGPTTRPSTASSLLPTVRPTIPQSLNPTVKPVAVPSFQPTEPTQQPNDRSTDPTVVPSAGPSSPSSHPTSIPTLLTEEPSQEPSEPPTIPPTLEPSDAPSRHPTIEPSESPTEFPTVAPSVEPTSGVPSFSPLTRNPLSIPTLLPSIASTLPLLQEFVIKGGDTVYNNSDSFANYRYVVNATGQVGIVSSRGANTYYIVPQTNLTLTIWTFNQSSDVIDLTLFTSIHKFVDLTITAGSINIRLSADNIVHILNLEPGDITEKNIVFSPSDSSSHSSLDDAISIMKFAIPLAGILLGAFFVYRLCYASARKAAAEVLPRKLVMVYASTTTGDYVFEDIENQRVNQEQFSDDDSSGIESFEISNETDEEEMNEKVIDRDAEDDLLSEHTLDSNGEWIFKNGIDDRMDNADDDHVLESRSNSSKVLSEFSINSDGEFFDML